MKRGPDDVTFTQGGQVTTCRWCGESVIVSGADGFLCLNDPECKVAHEAEMLEAQVKADEANWLRVEQLRNPQ